MEFKDNNPIYMQIANDIKEQIICGKLIDGDKLKSVREYSVFYEVTTLTIHRAMQLLEADEIVKTKKGVGSFIVSGVQSALGSKMVKAQVKEFIHGMGNMGISEEDILKLVREGFGK